MTNDAESVYIMAYCSPKRSGDHRVELQLNATDASISLGFNASEFSGGCSSSDFVPPEFLDVDEDGFRPYDGDCDDEDPDAYPGATEVADGVDQDCNGLIDDGTEVYDDDGDGYSEVDGDCDDDDAESTTTDIDADCDTVLTADDCDDSDPASTIVAEDADCDTVLTADDCNDTDATMPIGDADCDSVPTASDCDDEDDAFGAVTHDSDCDGTLTAVDCDDSDPASTILAEDADCDTVLTADDCNDTDATMPIGDADCDSVPTASDCDDEDDAFGAVTHDTDCDGTITAADCDDSDPASTIVAEDADCDGFTGTEDCDDSDPTISPGAVEICNGIDDDCDLAIDEAVTETFYRDADGDGHGVPSDTVEACSAPAGFVSTPDDCDDTTAWRSPSLSETCDGLDNDCDLAIDEGVETLFYRDADGDGHGVPGDTISACTAAPGYSEASDDCDDTTEYRSPSLPETCDDLDNDCNGLVDDGLLEPYYQDSDGDGFGTTDIAIDACRSTPGFALSAGDCDDDSSDIWPGATETCDLIDNDCDGEIDNDGLIPNGACDCLTSATLTVDGTPLITHVEPGWDESTVYVAVIGSVVGGSTYLPIYDHFRLTVDDETEVEEAFDGAFDPSAWTIGAHVSERDEWIWTDGHLWTKNQLGIGYLGSTVMSDKLEVDINGFEYGGSSTTGTYITTEEPDCSLGVGFCSFRGLSCGPGGDCGAGGADMRTTNSLISATHVRHATNPSCIYSAVSPPTCVSGVGTGLGEPFENNLTIVNSLGCYAD